MFDDSTFDFTGVSNTVVLLVDMTMISSMLNSVISCLKSIYVIMLIIKVVTSCDERKPHIIFAFRNNKDTKTRVTRLRTTANAHPLTVTSFLP